MKIKVGKFSYNTNDEAFRWTQQAKECYEIGCKCDRCDVKDLMESECNMKYCVEALIRTYGTPPIKVEHHRKTVVDKLLIKIGEME